MTRSILRSLVRVTSVIIRRGSRGRHRAGQRPIPPPTVTPPHTAPFDPPTAALRALTEESPPALVRPYIRAREQRVKERQAQRRRRVELWLALHGVDTGPRMIHGWLVPR
ncbi:hypothetical protein LO772_27250 [Yinghuangia sp. ASG 101]|uniref:hypothetical protein n=1 Tax=Yinghuangia sp. ASG 101 TaxID=2896848 RepID=UPI001E56FBA3|nr:hypothetical protein [Yinghuangia sp. ASG 101]UGQ10512.1 hypothetical protein LO772_27250 [Yinghuangia sp. ASG 101]